MKKREGEKIRNILNLNITVYQEVQSVFKAYSIQVDCRHLSLLADYMTCEGVYKGFNRNAIMSNPSPLQKITFETSVNFLVNSCSNAWPDQLQSPSARIVAGQVVSSGTGCFEIVQPLQVWKTVTIVQVKLTSFCACSLSQSNCHLLSWQHSSSSASCCELGYFVIRLPWLTGPVYITWLQVREKWWLISRFEWLSDHLDNMIDLLIMHINLQAKGSVQPIVAKLIWMMKWLCWSNSEQTSHIKWMTSHHWRLYEPHNSISMGHVASVLFLSVHLLSVWSTEASGLSTVGR